MCETLGHEGQKARCQSKPVEGIMASALSLCLCACLESVRAEGPTERRGLNSLPASPCVLIRAGWLEATTGAAVGDEEVSGSHEK